MASDGGLDVRSVIASGMDCPKVVADGAALTSDRRGKADGDYPVQTCIAHAAASSRAITVDGLAAPALPNDIKRIVVIGDTGCRLKGNFTQDCNDPVKWPFATVARLAAARHPDLVIHVGDYYYRETACPDTKPGCAGSPYGDNWAVWQKDFFNPAAPLLAVGAVGHGARQPRNMQPWRAWLVPSARSASERRQMHGHHAALRLAHRFAEPAAVRWRRRR